MNLYVKTELNLSAIVSGMHPDELRFLVKEALDVCAFRLVWRQETSDWSVERNCCRSGTCARCRPHKKRPVRIVHATGASKAWAIRVAASWTREGYAAKATRMHP